MNLFRHPLAKDALLTLLLGAGAFVALGATGWLAFVVPGFESSEDIAAEIDEVRSRDILEYRVVGGGRDAKVAYSYVGEPLPERIADDEIVERRKENSWSRLTGREADGDPIITTIFFPEDQFVSRVDGWHYVNYAEMSKERFDEARKERPLEALLWRRAHAATLTQYSGSGDGYTYNDSAGGECDTLWATTHDALTSSSVDSTSLSAFVSSGSLTFKTSDCYIYRSYFPFDTSSIPSGATISSASLNLYINGLTNNDNDGNDFLTVVQTSQATHTTLATADFDQCGAISNPTEGIDTGERKDMTSITDMSYLTLTLNATGRGWIKKSGQSSNCSATAGITCLGVREGHDVLNSAISNGMNNQAIILTSEQTGTSQDPYLSITYTIPNAFWQFQDY